MVSVSEIFANFAYSERTTSDNDQVINTETYGESRQPLETST